MNRFKNILKFSIIFLSGDLNILNQSPDYILEKFHYYFGDIKVNKHDECILYKKYKKIWKIDDYRINSILLFLLNIVNYDNDNHNNIYDPYGEENWKDDYETNIKNIAIDVQSYYELFYKWIGDVNDIPNIQKNGLHHFLKYKMYNVYKDTFLKD